MTYTLSVRRKAENDIQLAFQWYYDKSPKAAGKFVKQIDSALAFIAKNPFAFAVRFGNVRFFLLKGFPVCIHYMVIPGSEKVVILAVLHTSRNPEEWPAVE